MPPVSRMSASLKRGCLSSDPDGAMLCNQLMCSVSSDLWVCLVLSFWLAGEEAVVRPEGPPPGWGLMGCFPRRGLAAGIGPRSGLAWTGSCATGFVEVTLSEAGLVPHAL